MRRNRSLFAFASLAIFALIVAACGSPTPTRTPAPTPTVAAAATEAATEAATQAPTEAPTEAPTQAATQAASATEAPTEAATQAVAMATENATAEPTSAPTAEVTPEATAAVVAMATEAATAAPTAETTPEATAAATEAGPLACAATGDLIVGTDAAFPPFESIDTTTNEIVGFDVDLVKAIGAEAGFTPQFVNALFDTIFINLAAGEFHLVASGSTITAARLETVNFSNPYFASAQAIVMRAADATNYKSTADLAGLKIGVQLGTTGAEAAKDIPDTAGISEFQTAPEAFQALSNGDVDAVVNDLPVSQSIIANNPDLSVVIVDDAFTVEYYGIAVRKECTNLLDAVNSGLAAIIESGKYAEIYATYFGVEPSADFQKGATGPTLDQIMNPATPEPTAAPTAETTPEATAAPTQAAMAATEAAAEPTAEVTPEATAAVVAMATEAATAAPTAEMTAQATAAATEAGPLACAATGDLIVGTDAAFPPFESIDTTTNEIVGFDVDLVKAIGQEAGFTPQFVNALFDTIFINLAAGEFHLVASGSTITAARLETVNFSNPYFASAQAIVMRAADATNYKSTADLAGLKIGVQLGTTGAEAAKDIPDTAGISEFQTAPEAFQALSNGDVDAVVNDLPVSQSIIANNPDLSVVIVDDAFTVEYYGIAVRKECTNLLDAVNSGLAAIIESGKYAEIYATYFGVEPSADFQKGATGLTLDQIMNPATPEPTAAPTQASTAEPTPEATQGS